MFKIIDVKCFKYRPSSKKELEQDADVKFRKMRPVICVSLIHEASECEEFPRIWRITAYRKTLDGSSYWEYKIHSPNDTSKSGGYSFLPDRAVDKFKEAFRSEELAKQIRDRIGEKILELMMDAPVIPQSPKLLTPEQIRAILG